ncbi:MAG TPA: cupin domain-containing protein [Bacteroidetes bacterium]|nr:cupin domain-containing protein [Bacteroidota bacterium]
MPDLPVKPVYINPEEAGIILEKPLGKRLFQATGLELVTLRLEPGESLPLHINNQPAVFIVQRGQVELMLEDTTGQLSSHEGVYLPAGIPRGWNNPFSEPADLLVIKWL